MKQIVRIIGGKYRGKKLTFPPIEGLRPTPDRVKETLFNWLMHDIQGASCLDAFAGSGALGFEAYSRGASQVTFVESSRKAFSTIKQIAHSFNSKTLTVIHDDALHYLQNSPDRFDIVFLDPPFASGVLPLCMTLLSRSHLLRSGGLVYIESADKLCLDEIFWQEKKFKQAGQVCYGLYKKNSLPSESPCLFLDKD